MPLPARGSCLYRAITGRGYTAHDRAKGAVNHEHLCYDGFFPVEVGVRLAKPRARVDLTDYNPSTGHAWAEASVDGVTVMFLHGTAEVKVQPMMQAFFFLGDYLVAVEAPALPPSQMDEIVRGFIADHRDRLESATVDACGGVR